MIAETAAHLTVFQRTANYSVPARNGPLNPEFKRWIKDNMDEIRTTMHAAVNGHPFLRFRDARRWRFQPKERQARYEKAWETGGLRFRAIFRDLVTNNEANATASAFLKDKIRKIVKDPATADETGRHRPPLRGKAPADRHRLFRDFQSRQCRPGGCPRRSDRAITPRGIRTRAVPSIRWTSSSSRPASTA